MTAFLALPLSCRLSRKPSKGMLSYWPASQLVLMRLMIFSSGKSSFFGVMPSDSAPERGPLGKP